MINLNMSSRRESSIKASRSYLEKKLPQKKNFVNLSKIQTYEL